MGTDGTGTDGAGLVAEALAAARLELLGARRRHSGRHALPSRDAVAAMVGDVRAALFPDHATTRALSDAEALRFVGASLDSAVRRLREQVLCALWFACDHAAGAASASEPDSDCKACAQKSRELTEAFVVQLPAIRALLGSDVRAAYDGDPAAPSLDEALLCYAGLTAVLHYRLAHALHLLGVPLVPRIISALAHAETGVDIHPAARIGGRFFIDHATGVVIGETCVIGEHVRLYQSVTLGAKSFELDETGHPVKGIPRHPIVEDDVVIYAGATILGRITIGKGSIIGGNVWLTKSAPPGSRITQAQAQREAFVDGAGI